MQQITKISPTTPPPALVRYYVSPPKVIRAEGFNNFGKFTRPKTAAQLQGARPSPMYTSNAVFNRNQGFREVHTCKSYSTWFLGHRVIMISNHNLISNHRHRGRTTTRSNTCPRLRGRYCQRTWDRHNCHPSCCRTLCRQTTGLHANITKRLG